MNMTKLKWISALFSTLIIGVFEFVRHLFLDVISMSWGNLMVAALAGILFVFYFHGIFVLLENTNKKLQKEKEETAVLQERDRIARELHDSVAQALFYMNIKVMEIEAAMRLRREPFTEIKELQDAIKFTDAEIRQHIFALQQVTRENINLATAIEEFLVNYEMQNSMKTHLHIDGDIDTKLSNQEKKQMLRIFQELLLNIRKHAAAKQVYVSLIGNEQLFSMVICDNGRGFDKEHLKAKQSSFGFKNLEKDAQAINAKVDVQSYPGKGTTVTVSLDLN